MPDTANSMSEWADIDIFVGGLAIGCLIGALFAYWAIRAFKSGVSHGIERRMREERKVPRDCTCGGYYGNGPGLICMPWCDSQKRPTPPPPPPADEDPGKTVKSG